MLKMRGLEASNGAVSTRGVQVMRTPRGSLTWPRVRRLHIIGPTASGKSTLAAEIGVLVGAPVYHLDSILTDGPSWHRQRPRESRMAYIRSIVCQPAWVSEGVYLSWTEELLLNADMIIWLDHVRPASAIRRILTRDVARPMRALIARAALPDLSRQDALVLPLTERVSDLLHTVSERLAYSIRTASARGDASHPTRAAMLAALGRYGSKLQHCRREADVWNVLHLLGAATSTW